jgi:hypothetical protein
MLYHRDVLRDALCVGGSSSRCWRWLAAPPIAIRTDMPSARRRTSGGFHRSFMRTRSVHPPKPSPPIAAACGAEMPASLNPSAPGSVIAAAASLVELCRNAGATTTLATDGAHPSGPSCGRHGPGCRRHAPQFIWLKCAGPSALAQVHWPKCTGPTAGDKRLGFGNRCAQQCARACCPNSRRRCGYFPVAGGDGAPAGADAPSPIWPCSPCRGNSS